MVDIQFKKCCGCIPLRRGILTWGYLKLLLSLCGAIFFGLVTSFQRFLFFLYLSFTVILVIDCILTIVLIVGAHTKHVLTLRIYFWYSVVHFAILICIGGLGLVDSEDCYTDLSGQHCNSDSLPVILGWVFITITILGMQLYFILLLRSEIQKLNHETAVLFVNVANDVTSYDVVIQDGKKEKTDEKVRYDRLSE